VFESGPFDLRAYLERIGYEGDARPDLETFRALALRHPIALPFENLDPFLGRTVALDIASLQQKMVHGGRGGYCFEHNILLGTALSAIGFDVTGLAARVMWNAAPSTVTPRTHMLLLVRVGGEPHVADAGFGGLTLTGPLRLEADVEQDTPHERFRLRRSGSAFVMEASLRGEWKALYQFDLQPQALADYEIASWYLCNHPRSHFITSLVAARAGRDRRHALRNTEWATHHADGFTERRVLSSPAELSEVLADVFHIRVPDAASLGASFARLRVAPIAAP
jgi:N-hydroxyarylamine O-acetyltransferase